LQHVVVAINLQENWIPADSDKNAWFGFTEDVWRSS